MIVKNLALILLVTFFSSGPAWSQEIIPGLIPRFYGISAATDLPLSPEVAHREALAGRDLSLLEPSADTNIWRSRQGSIPNHGLIHGKEVEFVGELPSRGGQLRFTVLTPQGRELIVMLSKKVHNNLLRRNILAKLGYETQPMQWVPRLNLRFRDTIDRDLFKVEMMDKLLAGVERWVRNEDGLSMEIQDVLVLTPESEIYNLALGLMPESIHQGRRLLRAPYIPLALVDATESINLMPWEAGRVILNHLKLNHTQDLDTSYGTSWEDARWIGRRLARLTRKDLAEIVDQSHFPSPVSLLLTEKIIARRNDLMKLLKLDQEFPELPFNPSVSSGSSLVGGEIVQEFFDGYATRFSYGDPESPFSATELGSFALSRGQSLIISNAIGQFNKLLGTNDEKRYQEIMKDIIQREGLFFPTQAVALPTLHGNLILSRDIVTGSYMGTNNKVQLVDNFGYSLDAGVFAGIEGLPIPVSIKGGGSLAFQRVFSHVKPVESLKKSMKEPYRNMLVPLLLKDLAAKIDKLDSVSPEGQELMLQSVLGDLKGALKVGESFIITDSIAPRVFGEFGISPSQLLFYDKNLLKVQARVQSERLLVSRFHLFRAGENDLHVYQDYGKNLKLMLTMKLKSYVPILSFNGRWNQARAQTHFYPVSIHPQLVTAATLKALRQSILGLNHDALQDVVKHHRVEHDIKEGGSTLQLLFYKRNKIGSEQSMNLTHAQGGEQKEIQRRYDAVTSGVDYENFAVETLNDLVANILKLDISVSQVQTINPGFSLGGRANNKIFTSEFDGVRLSTNFQRLFNGWRVTPQRLRRIMETINREAGEVVFSPLAYMHTNSVLLYQVQLNYSLTHEGAGALLAATPEQFKRVLENHALYSVDYKQLDELSRWFAATAREIQRDLKVEDPRAMKRYHGLLRSLQDTVSLKGLMEIVGKENLAMQGRLDGFRQGDESGDSPIFSHVFGELPLPLHPAPTQRVMQNWGILEGELLANWMMERAI